MIPSCTARFAAALACLCIIASVSAHSGLYGVNITKYSKDFSAAWLISRQRFIASEPKIATAVSMASATFTVIRNRCRNCKTLVTRDFFDFMVEHLSSASNQLPGHDKDLFKEAIQRVDLTAKEMKRTPSLETDPRLDQTIGLLVYSSICFSMQGYAIQKTIRPAFFAATFWSIHRYVKNIVIYVANDGDAAAVEAMNLPYKRLTQLVTPFDSKNRTSLLPRDSMLHLLWGMKNNESMYSPFEYVFFSEGDQILHMREPEVMFDTIDSSGGTFITVPHRMQTLTLAQDFPKDLQRKWPKVHAQNIPEIEIAREGIDPTGSCCNNGDVEVAPCKGWWYQCPNYGVRDFPKWLKFGENGLTMPPVTEHKATCEYSAERRRCPVPNDCLLRVPTRAKKHLRVSFEEVCDEVVNTKYLGFGRPHNEVWVKTKNGYKRKRIRVKKSRGSWFSSPTGYFGSSKKVVSVSDSVSGADDIIV